jgi:hypothetical protein
MTLLATVDGIGIYGTVFHYSHVIALSASALLLFIYFWREGKLDMDEEAKFNMLSYDEEWLPSNQDESEEKR